MKLSVACRESVTLRLMFPALKLVVLTLEMNVLLSRLKLALP